ncbi:Hypothetical predicted protein [Olea europaea subsp. europaea]|uniref:DUF1985 domain-containing protein n=1 Tax=Olea europaea subsp. europaea TaxID=158383 RepID=A0A8S0PT55_OLEEU|nr:Hypothetical predicted protein [Olea europaea subsp. europaea]
MFTATSDIMDFQFLVPENVRLPAHISQRSNLKYVKTVMDNFDDRLRAEFRDSCLGFFADVPEIQFSAQLIQALEYAIITRLHAGSFPEGDRYTKALEKRRLKEKYFKSLEKISCAQLEKAFLRASTPRTDRYKLRLALIVEGIITAPDNNVGIDEDTLPILDDLELFFAYPWAKVGYRHLLKEFRGIWARKMSDTKMKNEKDVSYTIHRFPIVMQIWAYEVMLELGERFGERVGERSPRLLCWTSNKQPQQRTYDAFFRDVRVMKVVSPQFHEAAPASGGDDGSDADDGHDDESGAGAEDVDTSASDGHHTPEGNGEDGAEHDDSGESGGDHSSKSGGSDSENEVDASARQSGALPTPVVAGRQSGVLPTPVVAPSTYGVQGTRGGATMMREDVEGMLYDQRILFEMRLRTVKLEIMQHVTEEFARLRDFISTLVPSSSGTSTSAAAPVVNELNLLDDPYEDGQGSDVRSPHDDVRADDVEMQEGSAGKGSDKQSTHDDDHADEGEMDALNEGEGGDEQTLEDDDRTEEGDMQDMNDPGETVSTLPTDDKEGPSTHDVMEVDGFDNKLPVTTNPQHELQCGLLMNFIVARTKAIRSY